jgi:hypothetical protein
MAEKQNRILAKMLDRLFASMVNGPGLNCRPHSSRQRVDLTTIGRLEDIGPDQALRELLGAGRSSIIKASVKQPKRTTSTWREKLNEEPEQEETPLTPEEKAARKAWSDQQAILNKLRIIADDARTYENDTGVYALNLGFPLLTLPPNALGGGTRRIIAPLAFVPVALSVKRGATSSIELSCKGEGIDRVSPNAALLAWLEQQTGKDPADLFADEQGEEPWKEISLIVQRVCALLDLPTPDFFKTDAVAETLQLRPSPRGDELEATAQIIPAAVLGLFPASNQGLLRDTQAMVAEPPPPGPIESFIRSGISLDQTPEAGQKPDEPQKRTREFAEERLISAADPCQSRAVKLARTCKGLVIHGPPGTGKSQTITNIIGDHLARGKRVLMVCDKRTALDVVANRLEHMGLGSLVALVHDAQRDQRDLYKAIREQLEALPEIKPPAKAEKKVEKLDAELQELHSELLGYWRALMEADAAGLSFHELMGQWLAVANATLPLDDAAMSGVVLDEVEKQQAGLRETLSRAVAVEYASNPWVKAAGVTIGDFLARPMQEISAAVSTCVDEARAADAMTHPAIAAFNDRTPLLDQAAARAKLADALQSLLAAADGPTLSRWARETSQSIALAHQRFADIEPQFEILRTRPLDAELAAISRDLNPKLWQVTQELGALDAYLPTCRRWYAFLLFKKNKEASQVTRKYGLALSPDSAQRLRDFLFALKSRLVLQGLHNELLAGEGQPLPSDSELDRWFTANTLTLDLLHLVYTSPALSGLASLVINTLLDPSSAESLITGLRQSTPRAQALSQFFQALHAAKLFDPKWLADLESQGRQNQLALETLTQLSNRLSTLEPILRTRQSLAGLSPALGSAAQQLLSQSAQADEGLQALRRVALASEISGRLRANPDLQSVDAHRLQAAFDRYRELEAKKKETVRDAILAHWLGKQQERLLASTGSRLSSLGADLRRRLVLRGERALRLRQVIALGQQPSPPDPSSMLHPPSSISSSSLSDDPLFDICPVWMASPETVAQIFPLKPMFDVVIFDEASQCRLEEALPVLTRADRVVIAGDPKQLPPTRFFESAVVASDEDEPETDQDLFETQQGEIEDLLAAALNLEIDQSYLDVHYRSRNADLIEFSNQHFYSSRLQPIPAHPSNRTRFAPINLYRADGIYEDRANEKEAEQVVAIVRDLLKRADPPSIGIASFNITQRDLILEKLDELAGQDPDFARKLADARLRTGSGSFEGLFVKNLENVQGDERDHIIISTTYGPDPKGRFYKRFGPLGRSGGGRRLNVLITRARDEVHLVTSIPPQAYRNLPPIPAGQTAGGGWLLFAYLAYAEQLAEAYRHSGQTEQVTAAAPVSTINIRPAHPPSLFAQSLANTLAKEHHTGSDVHWGNDGFSIDLALHHPTRPDDVTLGLLCDGTRFTGAQDPIEWDLFRTLIHESQGWKLHRLWTPHFFRDPQGAIATVLAQAARIAEQQAHPDALRTVINP